MYVAATIANGEMTKTSKGELKIALKVDGTDVDDMCARLEGTSRRPTYEQTKAKATSSLRYEFIRVASHVIGAAKQAKWYAESCVIPMDAATEEGVEDAIISAMPGIQEWSFAERPWRSKEIPKEVRGQE